MTRKRILSMALLAALFGWFGFALVARAESVTTASVVATADGIGVSGYLLTWFLPLGVALVAVGVSNPQRAAQVVTSLPLALAAALAGFYVCGFAFQFGGLGLISSDPAFADYLAEWSPLDLRLGAGWGLLGLRGFMLGGNVSGGPVLALFLAQLPLVTTAALIPLVTMNGRMPRLPGFGLALLVSCLCYPLAGNWIQGGGWLSQLGETRQLGVGLVDGGLTWPHLVGAGAALAGLIAFRPRDPDPSPATPELPRAYLPLNVLIGAVFALVGWLALQFIRPGMIFPAVAQLVEVPLDMTRLMFHALVAVSAAALTTAFYGWLARGEPDAGLMGRGILAALIAVGAGLPYLPTWAVVLVAGLAGLILAPVMYLIERVFGLDDRGATVAVHGVSAILGLLAVGLFADGTWGVNGYWGAGSAHTGQLQAQLIGIGAVLLISMGVPWLLLAIIARAYILPETIQTRARERAARLRAERQTRKTLRLRGLRRSPFQRAYAALLHFVSRRKRRLSKRARLAGNGSMGQSARPASRRAFRSSGNGQSADGQPTP